MGLLPKALETMSRVADIMARIEADRIALGCVWPDGCDCMDYTPPVCREAMKAKYMKDLGPVSLKWITPDAEKEIVEIARVSADPKKQGSPDHILVGFLLRNHHWSPFEMANICFEVNTTRDIGRQMLRHWTMRPQEFSQRYQDVTILGEPVFREARLQDMKNRQASIEIDDDTLSDWWQDAQQRVQDVVQDVYTEALSEKRGIAKEVARSVLPEGMTPTRLYFNAPIRSALHFCGLRLGHGSQKEITAIASGLHTLMREHMPNIVLAFDEHRALEAEMKAIADWRAANPEAWGDILTQLQITAPELSIFTHKDS